MEDLDKIERDEVPENPYRVPEEVVVVEPITEEAADEVDTVISSAGMMDVRTDELEISVMNAEPNLVQNDIQEHEETKLPSNKAEYMSMSVAEKVRCYPFDTKGTEDAFNMVKDYFAAVGLDTSFHSVYEEAKILTDYYEKQKVEEFI